MVSILVVVDSLLQQTAVLGYDVIVPCFNPCCSGFIIATESGGVLPTSFIGFNPCCSGFIIATIK